MNECNRKTIDVEELLEAGDYAAMNNYIQENVSMFKMLLHNSFIEKLDKEIEQNKTLFSELVKKELQTEDVHFLLGRYIGFIDATDEFLSIALKEKRFNDNINSCNVSDIQRIYDILTAILQSKGISYEELSSKVKVEDDKLSEIIDKLIEYGLVIFTRPGKYTYYYLSEFGSKYYADNKVIIDAVRCEKEGDIKV